MTLKEKFFSECVVNGKDELKWDLFVNPALLFEWFLSQPAIKDAPKWLEIKTNSLPLDWNICLWCKMPVVEPPYVGSMMDEGFLNNYYTHYMPLTNDFFPADEGGNQ